MRLHLQTLDNNIISSPKHTYSGRNAILICQSKGIDELESGARRPHEPGTSSAKCMCLCTMSVPNNPNSNSNLLVEHTCCRIQKKRVYHNVMYSHFLPFIVVFIALSNNQYEKL